MLIGEILLDSFCEVRAGLVDYREIEWSCDVFWELVRFNASLWV